MEVRGYPVQATLFLSIVVLLPPYVFGYSAEYTDTDIKSHNVRNVKERWWTNCCMWCSKTSRCRGYAWSNYKGGTCWLKSSYAANLRHAAKGVRAGGCALRHNKDIRGNDLSNRRGWPHDCYTECRGNSKCFAYAWNHHAGGTCWFKKASSPVINKKGVTLQILRKSRPAGPPPPGTFAGMFPLPSAKSWVPTFSFDKKHECAPDYARNDRNKKCRGGLDRNVPVYYHTSFCGGNKYYRIQYWLFYGWQNACFLGFGKHDNDWEHVQVNFKRCHTNGKYCLDSVLYSQHSGFYTRRQTSGGIRAYVGKVAHGMYHTSCCWSGCVQRCIGGCGYFQDYRNPSSGDHWRPHVVRPVGEAAKAGGVVGNQIRDHWRKRGICSQQKCKDSGCKRNNWSLN